jgi:hypothetical protein
LSGGTVGCGGDLRAAIVAESYDDQLASVVDHRPAVPNPRDEPGAMGDVKNDGTREGSSRILAGETLCEERQIP